MNCYKEFSYIYDQLINADINYKAYGEFILNTCKEKHIEYDSYLDLACGTGNLTEHIYKNFNKSYAVDMSIDMLSEAENKFGNTICKPKFICQDIVELDLHKKFNLITCCLDSINYITDKEDLYSFFSRVKEHLEPGGVFVFDINSYYKLSTVLGNNTFTFDSDDVFYVWENSFEDDLVDMFLTFFIKEGDKYLRVDEEHSERAYTIDDIINGLNICKLKPIEILDCYENKAICDLTERITFVCESISNEVEK